MRDVCVYNKRIVDYFTDKMPVRIIGPWSEHKGEEGIVETRYNRSDESGLRSYQYGTVAVRLPSGLLLHYVASSCIPLYNFGAAARMYSILVRVSSSRQISAWLDAYVGMDFVDHRIGVGAEDLVVTVNSKYVSFRELTGGREIMKHEVDENKYAVVRCSIVGNASGKMYDFLRVLSDDEKQGGLAKDMLVVCDTQNGPVLCRVHEIFDAKTYNVYKANPNVCLDREVIDVVDSTAFTARRDLETKRAELKAKMAKRAKELQDISVYALLAKEDPEMEQMLKEYNNTI